MLFFVILGILIFTLGVGAWKWNITIHDLIGPQQRSGPQQIPEEDLLPAGPLICIIGLAIAFLG
jgi:hypothetical protein